MAIQTLNTLKGWAVKGWKPLATQVKDWFDSFWHKSEMIPMNKIEGLSDALNNLANQETVDQLVEYILGIERTFNAPGTFVIPDGKTLLDLRIMVSADDHVIIGSADGLDDILADSDDGYLAAEPYPVALFLYANGDRTIYIGGFASPVTIKFFIR